MHRIMRSLSRPNSVVETPQSKGRTSVRPNFGFLSSRTKSPTVPDIFVLQFPHRTVEQQLKQSTTPHITFSPAPPIPRREQQEQEQEQAQERGERFLHPNPKRQRRIIRRHNNSNNKNNDNGQTNKDMEIENIVVVPPRTRLFELKSSAEFAAEDFNHTIKTWVNMASLLVKQGNMAESNQDDENAYISYVRACLIITKIIPIQPHYRSMMNDIVCIDLRQKILVIITRMGHLEKRLLKRFEDDNRQAASQIKRGSTMTHLTSFSGKTVVASPMVHRQIHHHRPTSTIYKIEQTMNKLSVEYSPEEPVGDQDENDNDDDQELVDGSGVYDDENDGNDIHDDEVAIVEIQEDFSVAVGADLGLELSSESYISHHHRRTTTGSRSPSPPQPTQQHDYDRDWDQHHITPEKPLGGTLKKKSSNEDDRSLLSPECQPNFTAMPSALFPRQREGSHVRRCSSTDAIRTSVHFPATSSLSTATALPLTITPRAALTTPPVPVRSDKRASMMASVSVDRGSISTSSINYLRDRSNQGVTTVAVVPDYRGTAAAGGNSGAVPTTTAVRGGYDRDVLHSRFLNRRTLSFEGNGSSFYPPLGASSFDGSQQHQQQHQHQHQQQNFAGAHALRRHNSTSVGRVTPSSNNSSTNSIGSSHQKPATFNHQQLQQHQQQQQQAPQHQSNSTGVLSLNADLPPTPRSSLEKLSEHFSAGSSYNNINNNRSSPPSSASPSTATSTPLTSPMMKTSAQMNHGRGQGHEYGHSHGHGHTPSLSSSITSSSTLAMTESTLAMSSAPATATNSSITYTPTTMSVGSPQLSSTSSSPTMAGISTWATTGKKAGLLRKIRSKPKMQEMFDMVQATPSPPTPSPSTPSPVTPLPLALHRQQQYQQYQPYQQQQQQQQQAYPSIAMRS